jgi:hypothetical protein
MGQSVSTDTTGTLRGKTSAKIADPSGNVIELKSYDEPEKASVRTDHDVGGPVDHGSSVIR